MSSASALARKRLKVEDPEKYAAYLQREKERSKLRREKRKQKFENEPQTRATLQDKERELQLARERWRRWYKKKTESTAKRSTRLRSEQPSATPQSAKQPKHMTSEEFREHKRKLRALSRGRESSQKKRRVREKDAQRKRLERQRKKALAARIPGDREKQQESLTKTDYNFISCVRRKLADKAKTPVRYAKMVRNIAGNSFSPRKRQALKDHGVSVNRQSSKKKPFSALKEAVKTAKRILFRTTPRKKRSDAMTPQEKQKVAVFYMREDISRVLPHKRYATKHGPGYVMQQTLKSAYSIFKLENPDVKIGFTKFSLLRPKNVRKISSAFAETCQCVYCMNIRLKINAINRTITANHLSREMKLADEVAFANLVVCDKGDARFAGAECVHGTCPRCVDVRDTLQKHYAPLVSLNPTVTWCSWRKKKDDRKTTRVPEVKHDTFATLFEELIADTVEPAQNTTFVKHLFVAHWQLSQYRFLKQNLKDKQVLLVMDFAENRKAAIQDEIKSAHFDKRQITLHPIIAFYKERNTGELVRHALDFLTDDICHDHNAVHQFTEQTLRYLRTARVLLPDSEVIVFSDGCAAQYKGRGTFADLTQYSVPIQRVYFGSEHGKGEADGETGTISKSLDTAVLCRQAIIQSAEDLFSWAVENLTKDDPLSKRTFFLVRPDEIRRDRSETDVKGVPGSRGFHQVVKLAPFVFKARPLACFCGPCQERSGDCHNKQYTQPFKVFEIVKHVQEDCDVSFSENQEPPEDLQDIQQPQLSRGEFFTECQQRLLSASVKGFDAFLKCVVNDQKQALSEGYLDLPFPEQEPQFQKSDTLVDFTSVKLLPGNSGQQGRFPLQTAAFGNCLPLSLSAAVFGNTAFQQELRVRISWEMALKKGVFLSPENIGRGTDLDGCEALSFYHLTGDFAHLDLFSAYKAETMATVSEFKDLGPWQLLAAANVLERTIHSVYPDIVSGTARAQLNRPFQPVVQSERFPIFIFWTTTDEDVENINPAVWRANHFVPLVLQVADMESETGTTAPRIGDFLKITYEVHKQRKTYVAVVCPVPDYMAAKLREGDIVVRFLRKSQHGNYFVYPSADEIVAISFSEAEVIPLEAPTINQRGHHKFSVPV